MNYSVVILALLLSFAASLLLLARCLWRVGFGAENRKWIEAFYTILFTGAASFIAIDLLQASRTFLSSKFEICSDLAVLVLFTAVTVYVFQASSLHGSALILRRNAHSWLLIVLALSMSGWSYNRIQFRTSSFDLLGSDEALPGIIQRDDRWLAMTDEGTIVPLYRLATEGNQFEEYALTAEQKYKTNRNAMIHREDADKLANCHGWVFTEGRFLLKGNDVERVLCDNRYFRVADPIPGDIVIYRHELGGILHTALVQGILRDGTVITESKWGIDQRFLHLPADQPYSPIFEYYRTDRPSHLIDIRESMFFDDNIHDG